MNSAKKNLRQEVEWFELAYDGSWRNLKETCNEAVDST